MWTYESTSGVFPLQNTSRKNRAWSSIPRCATWSLSCTANPAHVTATVGGSRCVQKGPRLLELHPKLCSAAATAGLSPRIYLQKIKLLSKTLCGIFGTLQREDNEQGFGMNSGTLKKAVHTKKPEVSPTNWLWHSYRQRCFLHKRGIHNDKRCNTLERREHEGWNQLEPHETGIKQDAQWAQTQRNRLKTSNASKRMRKPYRRNALLTSHNNICMKASAKLRCRAVQLHWNENLKPLWHFSLVIITYSISHSKIQWRMER